MSAITAKASRKMKKYAVLTREPRCFLGSFDFSWEQRKLGDVVKEITRNDPESEAPIMMITSNNGFIEQSERYAFNNAGESLKKYILLKKGELAYNHGASKLRPYGSCFALTTAENARIPFVYHCFSAENQNAEFMSIELNGAEIENQLRKIVSSGARMDGLLNISFDEYTSVSVLLPGTEEQDRIADFFRHLDNLITLHQRKCALLFSPFQAFISMMFTTSTFSWEQRKLSEITDKVTEKNAGLQYVETFTNSAEFGIISQRDFFDHDIAKLGSLDGYYIVKTEDFVYNPRISTSAPVGPINRNKLGRTGVMSPLYTVFRPHDIDTTYLEYFFKCGYWHSFMNFNGDSGARSDRFSIRDNVFFQMPIPIPNIDEQRKIGELLTCLDNLITLHQRKCIFFTGRAGRLISTVNKKRITSSWEQRKLGDMMNVTSVKRIHQSDWTDSGVRFLRARDIVAAAKNEEPDDYLYISKEKYEEYSTLSGKVGVSDLLVTGVGTIGVPYLVRNLEPLYFKDGNIIWFQNLDKIDGKFLFYSFSAEQIQGFINESAGIGTVGTYTIESGKKTPISLPNQIEQAKVGEFFQQLDNLITLHQRKPFLMKWRTSDANRNQTNRLVL